MPREAFVLLNGESFSIWEITFTEVKRQRESHPCLIQEPDGRTREGTISFTMESGTVSFSAPVDMFASGSRGQMSSGDEFFEVTISSVKPEADHLRVSGRAERRFDYKKND